jgi:hypothetical protein
MAFGYFTPIEGALFEHCLFQCHKDEAASPPRRPRRFGSHRIRPAPRENPLTSGTAKSYCELCASKGKSEIDR